MTDKLSFANNQWIWPVVIIGLLLLLIFAWKERASFGRTKFYLHLFISLLGLFALAMIVLQPLTISSKKATNAVLLTDGYNSSQLDSLKKSHKKLKILSYKPNAPILDGTNVPNSIFILGNGLKAFDLWQLDGIHATYFDGRTPKGITKLMYDTHDRVGNRATIKGRYKKATAANSLLLEGPGGTTLDSVTLTTGETQNFQLTTGLNVAGNYLYALVTKDSLGKVLSSDPLPISVSKQTRLKILMINRFPTFETKYLKNYLAEAGHQVLVKSQLTTAKYKYEYFNMDSRPSVGYTLKQLQAFDLVIIDALSLRNLSRTALSSLEQSVRENGLGIFIQPDQGYFQASKRLQSFAFISDQNQKLQLEAWPGVNISKYGLSFKDEFKLEPIHISNTKIYSAYKRLGTGRIGTTVLQNTFELILNGHTNTYQYLWSKTIEQLGKKENPTLAWNADEILGYKDMPYTFKFRTAIPKPVVKSDEGYTIPMRRDIDIASLWKGTAYPRETGWKKHWIEQDSKATFHYYVTDTSHWRALRDQKTIETNKRYFDKDRFTEKATNNTMRPINPIWFYIIFVLSIGYLWLEPKL